MNDALSAIGLGGAQVLALMLVIARVAPLFALAPIFSATMIPRRVRAICAVALAVGLLPAAGRTDVPGDALALAATLAGEVAVGMAFAFAITVLFAAISAAGSLIDTMIGFSFGALVDPVTGAHASVLSQLYSLVAAVVFIAIGGDKWVLGGLARTYELVPLGALPAIDQLAAGALRASAGLFVAAVQVAAPALLALVLTDAAFGVVSRAVPQMNVFAVGFAAKIVVGLLVVAASLPFVAAWLADRAQVSITDALRALVGG